MATSAFRRIGDCGVCRGSGRGLRADQLTRFRQMRRRFEESRMPGDRNALETAQPPPNKQRPQPAFVKQNNLKRQF